MTEPNITDNDNEFEKQTDIFLDKYIDRLFAELDKERIIKSLNKEGKYTLNVNATEDTVTSNTVSKKNIFQELFHFRNIVQSVYRNLPFFKTEGNKESTLTQILTKLEERGAIDVPWVHDINAERIFNKLDGIATSDEEDTTKTVENFITKNKIRISSLIVKLLDYYGKEVALEYFDKYDFVENNLPESSINKQPDLLISFKEEKYPKLIFEFLYRKRNPLPDKEIVLRALRYIDDDTSKNKYESYFIITVFTDITTSDFNNYILKFNNLLREFTTHQTLSKNVKFIPVSTQYLHLMKDGLKEFSESEIQQNIKFIFTNQNTPVNRRERNDHFYDKIFDIRKSDFVIKIDPDDTETWRFGLRFSPSLKFPPITEGRHVDERIIDIHVGVGDLIEKGITWINTNKIGLFDYHAKIIDDNFSSYQSYNREPVVLRVSSNNLSVVEFSLEINHTIIGSRTYDLRGYDYCKIFGWRDFSPFRLDTEIRVIHKRAIHKI